MSLQKSHPFWATLYRCPVIFIKLLNTITTCKPCLCFKVVHLTSFSFNNYTPLNSTFKRFCDYVFIFHNFFLWIISFLVQLIFKIFKTFLKISSFRFYTQKKVMEWKGGLAIFILHHNPPTLIFWEKSPSHSIVVLKFWNLQLKIGNFR